MSRNIWPSWLTRLQYPFSGIGDLDDLKFSVNVAEDGKWIGFVNTGWFYHATKEQYKYVIKGSVTVAAAAGTGQVTESISFRPSWGPILLDGADGKQYSEHHNSFSPGETLTWASLGYGGLYYSTIATGAILVGMRDLTNLALGSVTGSGDVISEKFYWYDDSSRRVHIKPKNTSNINIFADILYEIPRLRMRELVIQDDNGVRPSYKIVEQLYIRRGLQNSYVQGPVSGFITNPLTGVVKGDWVTLDYYVPWSYVVTDHQHVQFYTSRTTGDVITVSYETSIPDIIPPATLTKPATGKINLNPLYSDSYRSGYLFHCTTSTPGTSIWVADKIIVELDKKEVCSSWNETIKVSALVLDINGLPIPWYPIHITTNSSGGITELVRTPSGGTTDGRGEFHGLYTCSVGLGVFSIGVWTTGVTGFASADVFNSQTVLPSSLYEDGFAGVIISSEQTSRRYFKGYTNSMFLDGIPRADNISLVAELASEFEIDGTLYTKTASLSTIQDQTSVSAIKQFGYLPQPKDRLAVFSEDGQSKIIITDEVQ